MTTSDQISAWAASGESEILEFKRTTGERREAARTLCAMLNHRGGRVLFGIEPDGRVIGQQVSDHSLEEVWQEIREIDPPAFPTIDRVDLTNGRTALVANVSTGHSRPYSFRGQAYRRVGNVSAGMSRDEYNLLLMERLHSERRWENEPAGDLSVADLELSEIVRTLEEAKIRRRLEDSVTEWQVREDLALLKQLGLIRISGRGRGARWIFI